jgi:hypothetical protein
VEGLVKQTEPLRPLGYEALLRGLLGDAHGLSDLGPGRARLASLVDEVADEVIGHLVKVLGYPHGCGHVT